MPGKRIGECCPKCCSMPLQKRRTTVFRGLTEVAYCARCDAAFELAAEAPASVLGALAVRPAFAG